MIRNVPTVAQIMSPKVFTLDPDMPISEAIDLLLSRKASGAPVVDKEGRLVGILSEKDCLRVLSNEMWDGESTVRDKVRDYASDVKQSLEPQMDLFSAAQRFLQCHFATLPVIEGDQLVGIITRQDMLRGVKRFQQALLQEKLHEQHALKVYQHPASIDEMQEVASVANKEQLASLLSRRHGE